MVGITKAPATAVADRLKNVLLEVFSGIINYLVCFKNTGPLR
jgi:hypothetical protein